MNAGSSGGMRVLVTGAGNGVGKVIATKFLAEGARVVVCDLNVIGLTDIRCSHGQLHPIEVDAGDEASVATVYGVVRDHLGGLDVLVNNVGIAGPTTSAEAVTLDEWNDTLRVNLTSHFLFARSAIPMMKAQGTGLIVNISSGSAKTGLPLRLPYVVSKGAILSLTTNLARELGPSGIRVNAILPGAVCGARIESVINTKAAALGVTPENYKRSLLRYISLRTMVRPDDIAAMIAFLASEAGSRISGQLISIDGNMEWEE